MKRHDLTQSGGFPFDQDQMKHLADGITDGVYALARTAGTNKFKLWGCDVTKVLVSGTTYNFSVSAGAMFCDGEVVQVPAMSLSGVDVSVYDVYFEKVANNTTLTYFSGATHASQIDNYMKIEKYTIGTSETSTKFLYTNLVLFGKGFGENNRESSWTSIAVATGAGNGSITGTIYYKKDTLNNTVRVRGILSVGTPSDFAASPELTPVALVAAGSLPSGYRPVAAVHFAASAFDGSVLPTNRFKNDAGDSYIDRIGLVILTNGSILGYFIKPDAGVTGYLINFYQIVPID